MSDRALDTDQGQKVVYVVDKNNKVASRPVRLGAVHDGLRELDALAHPGHRCRFISGRRLFIPRKFCLPIITIL